MPEPDFDGETYDRRLDHGRLTTQQKQVYGVMCSGSWLTLAELEERTGFPQASISARLRDLRKDKFGGYNIERRRRSQGTFEYRLAGLKV